MDEVTRFQAHDDVAVLTVSSNTILSASADGVVAAWDDTGRRLWSYKGVASRFTAIASEGDYVLLGTGSGALVRVVMGVAIQTCVASVRIKGLATVGKGVVAVVSGDRVLQLRRIKDLSLIDKIDLDGVPTSVVARGRELFVGTETGPILRFKWRKSK